MNDRLVRFPWLGSKRDHDGHALHGRDLRPRTPGTGTASDSGTGDQVGAEQAVLIHVAVPVNESDEIGLDQIEDPIIEVLERPALATWTETRSTS